MITESSTCPKCGAPIFEVNGQSVSACTCGKISQPPPTNNPFNSNQYTDAHPVYEVLKEIISAECTDKAGDIDSGGKYYFSKAIKILHQRGEVNISSIKGPIIKGNWR